MEDGEETLVSLTDFLSFFVNSSGKNFATLQ